MEVHVIKRCFAQCCFALLDLLGDLGLLFCGLDGNGSGGRNCLRVADGGASLQGNLPFGRFFAQLDATLCGRAVKDE